MDRKYAEFLLNKTKKDYNLIAEDFSRTRERPWEEIRFLFDDYLNSGEKILDLGCGNGRYLEFFKGKGADYYGVDNSEELIEIARKLNPRFNFQIADGLNLPFADNHFDKVYSIAVLHHIPSEELRTQFLKEAKRVLKPGGSLILTVWNFHWPKERYLLFKYTILKLFGKSKLDWRDILDPWGKKIERYYHWFSSRELTALFKKAGLIVKKTGTTKNKKGNRQNIYIISQKPL